MSGEITIALIDDHTVVRNGLKSLIEVMGNYKVTAQFDNGQHFVNSFPLKHEPDLVIMDLNMPEMNGLETMRWLHKNKSPLKVLILTLESEERTIIELFRLGVRGYLPKSCSAEVLKRAIDDTISSGYYHSDILQKAMSSGLGRRELQAEITEREKVFLQLICKSDEYTYEQIADIMNLSKRTIDGYRESLFEKCEVRSKTGLVLFAIKHGLVEMS
jgi:two-component system, NarL family, invasion response regulator UvrY